MITVNESIASAYRAKYGIDVAVVRNMPRRQLPIRVEGRDAFLAHGVPTDLPIALMQGAYMDRDRGAAQAVAALPEMKGVRLVLVGAGVEWDEANAKVNSPEMQGRLHTVPKLPFDQLRRLTASADVGLSLDQAGHGNYEMSLPNKLFDFMHGGLPMVVTARKEVAAIVLAHELGEVVGKRPHCRQECSGQSAVQAQIRMAGRVEGGERTIPLGCGRPSHREDPRTSLKAHLAGSHIK